jgi:hypothetical protein
LLKRLSLDFGAALGMVVVLSLSALGQITQAALRTATIMGTVTDVNFDAIPNATVVLKEVEGNAPLTIVTTKSGMFEFHDVTPGITYQISISANDFGAAISKAASKRNSLVLKASGRCQGLNENDRKRWNLNAEHLLLAEKHQLARASRHEK